MQFSIVALFIGAAIATPVTLSAKLATRDGSGPCDGGLLYGNAVCCSTNVLGVASLSCSNPSSANDSEDLKKSCGAAGASAHCCTLFVAGLGVLCKEV